VKRTPAAHLVVRLFGCSMEPFTFSNRQRRVGHSGASLARVIALSHESHFLSLLRLDDLAGIGCGDAVLARHRGTSSSGALGSERGNVACLNPGSRGFTGAVSPDASDM
jgi:hypothetical protein